MIGIEIAGLRVVVNCENASVSAGPDTAYNSFLSGPDTGAQPADVKVLIELKDMPTLAGMKKIFESDQSWSLFSDDGDYYLSLNPPATGGRPAWIARFDRNISKAAIFCDRSFIAEGESGDTVINPVRYPLDQILMMYLLSRKDGAIIHAAGVRIGNGCYIFPGRSGAGKSTISRQMLGLKRSCEPISDDRVAVRKTDSGYTAFGTPWPGEGGFAMNKGFPLSGIFFLSQSDSNVIEKIGPQEALERLLPVASIPWYDPEVMTRVLQFCGDLVSAVPSHVLHFTPGDGIIKVFDEIIER